MASKTDEKLLLIACVLKKESRNLDISQLQEITKLPVAAINRSISMNIMNELNIVIENKDGTYSFNEGDPIAKIEFSSCLSESGKTEEYFLAKTIRKKPGRKAEAEQADKQEKAHPKTTTKKPKPQTAKVKSGTKKPSQPKPKSKTEPKIEKTLTREEILKKLETKPMSAAQLATELELDQNSLLEELLGDLSSGGVISSRKLVNSVVYHLNNDDKKDISTSESSSKKKNELNEDELASAIKESVNDIAQTAKDIAIKIGHENSAEVSKKLTELCKSNAIFKASEPGPAKYIAATKVKPLITQAEPLPTETSKDILGALSTLLEELPKKSEEGQIATSESAIEQLNAVQNHIEALEAQNKKWAEFGQKLLKFVEENK